MSYSKFDFVGKNVFVRELPNSISNALVMVR